MDQVRQRKPKLIVTFPSVTAAMTMEDACKREGLDGRLIPTPQELTAGCGLSWACEPEAEVSIKALLEKGAIPFGQVCVLQLL
ncbi:DUF3343 domain-containing protein [Christensenellaceae bacterium OttesenSCG-928-M15]|nr:DUF3343 domain-containing protein [Christensenellaceae bacterium OttesenSCG-928-M15]